MPAAITNPLTVSRPCHPVAGFPKRNRLRPMTDFCSCKSFVLSFLTLTAGPAHIWRRIPCNSFVITFPAPGGYPPREGSEMELAPYQTRYYARKAPSAQ